MPLIRGGTYLLLLIIAVIHSGQCLPHGPVIENSIIATEVLKRLHEKMQLKDDLDAIEQEFETVANLCLQQLAKMLDNYKQRQKERPLERPHTYQDPLYEQVQGQLEEQLQPYEVDQWTDEDKLNAIMDLQPEDDKRDMSLCHFKICNMGRKRSVGSAMPLSQIP
ncbi:uncharacterized protein LOC132194975 isoform X2 [Neocloeon triangulifer]|uniref:uncharacterized protein LOC132194975 isoform X2 n=1 Tax=Neocloeon triangulifer TaxID=2078957 RepID=UPI00286EF528|nr:uncharacterized protein LOC132194975 isoform X2 [Neocloeon triangulifer]